MPTPSLRKHIRKRDCVHVIFLDGERQKKGGGEGDRGGNLLAVKFYVMFTCQSKGSTEMKAVITTGSLNVSPASLTARRRYLIWRTCGRRRRERRRGNGGRFFFFPQSSKRRLVGEGKKIRWSAVTMVNREASRSRTIQTPLR